MLRVALESCIRGDYPVASERELREADSIVAQSFGTREANGGSGRVNILLAQVAQKLARRYNVPLVAQEEIAENLPDGIVDVIVAGDPSSATGGGLDSWTVLQTALTETGTREPMIVAQAYHIGRMAAQAVRLGLNPHLPAGMPREFAPGSRQPWTRSHGLWVTRELPGMVALKVQKKL